MKSEQSLRDVTVVLEHTDGLAGDAVAGNATDATVDDVDVRKKGRAVSRGCDEVRPVEHRAALGKRRDGESVPRGDNLVVSRRSHPLRAYREQPRAFGGVLLGIVGVAQQLQHGSTVLERAGARDLEHAGGRRADL